MMNISIGILAHNEEMRIRATMVSLFEQTIFESSSYLRLGIENIQVACLANGCNDRTSTIAREVFDGLPTGRFALQVVDIIEAGKSRSWNIFVHSISDPSAKYLVLQDADIEFGANDVLEKLIVHLEGNSEVMVATDKPIKMTEKKNSFSLQERISLSASDQIETAGSISGQLYCGRSLELRRHWMPLTLPVEDGFLAAMIATDGFTRSPPRKAIAEVPNVFHYYEVHEGLYGFIRHESRIVVGGVINSWLFSLLWEKGKSGHVGNYIRNQNITNPAWIDDLVMEGAARSGWWLVPMHFVFKRLAPLRHQTFLTKLKMAPIAIISTAMEIVVCLQANRVLRRSGSAHFW
jgi:glycosyltransferase involved in cell wall biosynthesis